MPTPGSPDDARAIEDPIEPAVGLTATATMRGETGLDTGPTITGRTTPMTTPDDRADAHADPDPIELLPEREPIDPAVVNGLVAQLGQGFTPGPVKLPAVDPADVNGLVDRLGERPTSGS